MSSAPPTPVIPFQSPTKSQSEAPKRDTLHRLFSSYASDDFSSNNPFNSELEDPPPSPIPPLVINNHRTASPLQALYNHPLSVTASTSSASATMTQQRPGQHLRRRSIPTRNENPFESSGRGEAHAVMMAYEDPDLKRSGTVVEKGKNAARDFRGDKAEWLPIQQHLYPQQARSPSRASSIRSFSTLGSTQSHSVQSTYDLALISPSFHKSMDPDDDLHTMSGTKTTYKREGRERRIVEVDLPGGKGVGGVSVLGVMNLLVLVGLFMGLTMLFAGYPIYTHFTTDPLSNFGALNIGGTNGSGQVPNVPGFRGLIDKDTPDNVMTRTGFDGKEYQLVFSDEFNTPGRTFGPGEDPYWEAVDLHYYQTNDLEWYTPDNIITQDGYLAISLTQESLEDSHGLGFLGGMLQSWNKFCFTGGYVEVAISLPGDNVVSGLWPAAWTMANLGRAGYGGSLDGMWPYVYESCDIGTLANQTNPWVGGPEPAISSGIKTYGNSLSYLPGQRLSACTCPGENHPGPVFKNGSFPGRGAAEIDIFEALVNTKKKVGQVSQSAQWAPFNPSYSVVNSSTDFVEFFNTDADTTLNTFDGNAFQQTTSALSTTNASTYNSTTKFEKYGLEYQPSYFEGFGTGKITWSQGDQQMWRVSDSAMEANTAANVSNRVVTGEPMYIIMNLGMSKNFGTVDLANLVFPAIMRVDYVRVYQDTNNVNYGCDPPLFPTADYIAKNLEAYENPNNTGLADMNQTFPKNRLIDDC